MEDLKKIDSLTLYRFWKTFAVSLALIIGMFTLTKIFSPLLSPVFGLLCAGLLYNQMITARSHEGSCVIVPYAIFVTLIVYSFISIIVNIIDAWGVVHLPTELLFYNGVYIPSLVYLPIASVTLIVISIYRKHLSMCMDCKLTYADSLSRNKVGHILKKESHVQLRNLTVLFSILSIMVWTYFLVFYVNIGQNARDWYIFTWLIIISFILDEVYFIFRYYNLYLDLKDHDEVITPAEIEDIDSKTYLRFYVICDNHVYCDMHRYDSDSKYGEVIDTAFFTKRNVNGIAQGDVYDIIKNMTGADGQLKFFFGRKTGIKGHTLLRYFYFLDGKIEDHTPLRTSGEWVDYSKIKHLYSTDSARLATLAVIDTTRLSTIMLTQKIYDERGFRRSGIKTYMPNFTLDEVRTTNLDFQDEKWIKVAMFNSDTRFFRIKRWWRQLIGRSVSSNNMWII